MRLFRLQSIIGPITYLLVGVMAAWPRLLNLDQFLTVDEANFWIARSERFLNAMRAGDWLATAISTHPGVMTMWSGALGILIRRPLLEAGILSSLSVAEAIGLMRLPMALIHTCAVLIGYGLLRRMLSPLAAFLAAIFWALDPFVVAYSRLLHVDAPLTSLSPAERRLVALLAVWVLLLTVALSIFPKKFNRYILPVFPLLDVLAALGIARIAQLLIDRTRAQLVGVLSAGIGVALATVACFNMLGWHPYGIAAFNQALGGAQAGREVFAVGWGEGFELVAAWLNQRPDITGVSTVSRIPVVQNPYMRERANAETPKGGVLPDAAGYLVVYVSQIQRSDPSPPFTDFYLQEQPLHVVQIEGVDYAWIYQVPPRSAVATPAWFGDRIQLRGYTIMQEMQPGGVLIFELVWALRTPQPPPLMLFAHLIGPDGQRVSQVDLPLPTEGWQLGEYRRMQLPLGVPGELVPGSYRVVIGLYDPQSGARLPLDAALMADPALSGDRALLLATITHE